MKSKACRIALVGLSLLLGGCWQKSVYPFYTDKDLIFDPGLAGTWSEVGKEAGQEDTWNFTRDGEKGYRLAMHAGNTDYNFDARLFNLGSDRFLDLYSQRRSMSEIPAHHLIRMRREGAGLRLELLSMSWVRGYLKGHPQSLAHVRAADPDNPQDEDKAEMVLTAGTEALQQFVRQHQPENGFFDQPVEFHKTTP